MRRRQFIRNVTWTGSLFVVGLTAFDTKKADAFLMLMLRGAVMRTAFRAVLKSSFQTSRPVDKSWWEDRRDIQIAQKELLARSFQNITVAEVDSPRYTAVIGAEKTERLGINPSLCFSQYHEGDQSMAAYSGPACIGMSIAAEYLQQHEKMSFDEVQASILPRYQQYSDWGGWSASRLMTTYANQSSDEGVLIRYDSVDPRSGGHGTIDVIINAERRIRIPTIKVQYV
jgi:hypothetical protein